MAGKTICQFAKSYRCDIAATPDGWALATVGLPAIADQFVRNMDHEREWEHIRAMLYPRAQL